MVFSVAYETRVQVVQGPSNQQISPSPLPLQAKFVLSKIQESVVSCPELSYLVDFLNCSTHRNDAWCIFSLRVWRLDIYREFVVCRYSTRVYLSDPLHDSFWYFAARENNDTAPLALWFNGGVSPHLSFQTSQLIFSSFIAWKFQHARLIPGTRPLQNK